ncbi:hypothetical protein IQ255_25105 [Pleurocapsales cyanobacterium LEGE 10410]|nr:hypothetical protein [Pleurocapsales cyanobacterium LEGE 10410]
MSTAKDSQTNRLLQFLGIPDQNLTLPCTKAISISLKNSIENYEEVVRELRKT